MPKQTLDQSFQFLLDLTTEKELAQLADDIVFDSDPEFEQYLDVLAGTTEFSLDIETYGDIPGKAFEPEEGEIRLIQVYLKEIEKCLIWDLGRPKERKVEVLPNQQYDLTTAKCKGFDVLIKKCENLDTVVNIQNAAFEGKWFYYKFGILIFNIWDSMICSQVIWAGTYFQMSALFPKPHSLASIAKRVGLGVLDKENQTYDYALPLHNEQYNYAATDVRILPRIKDKLLEIVEEIDSKHLEFYREKIAKGTKLTRYQQFLSKAKIKNTLNAEMRAIPAFIQMRCYGFPVNSLLLQAILNEYRTAAKIIEAEVSNELGCLITSPSQLLPAIKEKLGFVPTTFDKKTKTQKESTNSDALGLYEKDYPVIKKLLMFRTINIIIAQLESIQRGVRKHPVTGLDCLYGRFVQNASQATGRSSCSGAREGSMNLQQVAKLPGELEELGLRPIRLVFSVPNNPNRSIENAKDDEWVLLLQDAAGSHGVIGMHLAGSKTYFEAQELGIKFHYYTAAKILELQGIKYTPKELKQIHKKEKNHKDWSLINKTYALSKTVFYACMNGSGASTLQISFKKQNVEVSLEDCAMFIQGWRNAYPEVYALQKEINTIANGKNLTFKYDDNFLGDNLKYFGEVRSPDGGRYLLRKKPSNFEKQPWSVPYTDAIAFNWLRLEATNMKAIMGILVKEFYHTHPEWLNQVWIAVFSHDEIVLVCKKKIAREVGEIFYDTFLKLFRWIIDSYQMEGTKEELVISNWNEK